MTPEGLTNRVKHLFPLILSGFLLVFILLNFCWLRIDRSTPADDEAKHLKESVEHYYFLKEGNYNSFFFQTGRFYPPLVYQVTSIAYLFTGPDPSMGILSLSVFWILLAFSVYRIGGFLFDPGTGLLAGIGALAFPLSAFMSHEYFLDLPAAAFTSAAVLMLFLCKDFDKKPETLAFFVFLGLGALTKWVVPVFVLFPFIPVFVVLIKKTISHKRDLVYFILAGSAMAVLLVLGQVIIKNNSQGPDPFRPQMTEAYFLSILPLILLFVSLMFIRFQNTSVKNFLLGSNLFFIIIWNFYALNIPGLPEKFRQSVQQGVAHGYEDSPLSFIRMFVEGYLGLFLSVCLLAGVICYLFFYGKKSLNASILLWGFAGGVLFLCLWQHKFPRYFLPLIAFCLPFCVFWRSRIKNPWLRTAVSCIFVIFFFLGSASWIIPSLAAKTARDGRFLLLAKAPDPVDWRMKDVAEAVVAAAGDQSALVLYATPHREQTNGEALSYELFRLKADGSGKIYNGDLVRKAEAAGVRALDVYRISGTEGIFSRKFHRIVLAVSDRDETGEVFEGIKEHFSHELGVSEFPEEIRIEQPEGFKTIIWSASCPISIP